MGKAVIDAQAAGPGCQGLAKGKIAVSIDAQASIGAHHRCSSNIYVKTKGF